MVFARRKTVGLLANDRSDRLRCHSNFLCHSSRRGAAGGAIAPGRRLRNYDVAGADHLEVEMWAARRSWQVLAEPLKYQINQKRIALEV
ncbi:MAG: hypothetical protein ACFB4I_19860 [Cyanophyceae cyanobacterium]